MAHGAHHRFTFADYVQIDEDSRVKLEFLDGQVWAMAGGSPDHAAIAANIIALLGARLVGQKCRVFTSDLRVRVKATGLGTYPDVSVVCGAVEIDPEDPKKQTVTNPRVVIEVLSPSTEEYDRGEKLAHYKRIASLQEVVLVAQDRRTIEIVRRDAQDEWSSTVASSGNAELRSLGCSLALDDVYRDPLS
jgi:Uma2 family endonuclease